jgi:hypothetical protein
MRRRPLRGVPDGCIEGLREARGDGGCHAVALQHVKHRAGVRPRIARCSQHRVDELPTLLIYEHRVALKRSKRQQLPSK